MKKYICIVLITSMLLLAGCGSREEQETQTYAWPLATSSTTDTITHIFAQAFVEEVNRLSDGEIKIQVYPQSTLGGDRELLESCKDGDIPFIAQSPAPQVSFMPELCVLDAPCVYQTLDEARAAIDRESVQTDLNRIYEDAGYRLLGIADQGFRVMTTAKPFKGLESVKGQKIRTMENNFHIQFWKTLGANPSPMSFSEVYIGLQQGTIDAQENAYEIIVSAKLYEQQKYVVELNWLPDYITLIVSDKFFEGLPEETQELIMTAAENAQETARNSADDRIVQRKAYLIDEGLQFTEIEDETWDEMKSRCGTIYENIKRQSGEELFNAYTGAEE